MKSKQAEKKYNLDEFEDLTRFADESFDTDEVDLFQFSGEESSPLTRLKSIILSLEWEITDEYLQELADELHELAPNWQGDKVAAVYLQGLAKIGKYLRYKGAYAHPNSVKLLLTFFHHFETIISAPDITGARITELLKSDVRKFKVLQYQIQLAEQMQHASGELAPPVGVGLSESAPLGDDLPLTRQLKAAILGLDWEVTDESLHSFTTLLSAVYEHMADNKAALLLVQGLQVLGEYISEQRAEAHGEAFNLLHAFYEGLEEVVEEKLAPGNEKRIQDILLDRVNRLNHLKRLIAPSSAVKPEEIILEEATPAPLQAEVAQSVEAQSFPKINTADRQPIREAKSVTRGAGAGMAAAATVASVETEDDDFLLLDEVDFDAVAALGPSDEAMDFDAAPAALSEDEPTDVEAAKSGAALTLGAAAAVSPAAAQETDDDFLRLDELDFDAAAALGPSDEAIDIDAVPVALSEDDSLPQQSDQATPVMETTPAASLSPFSLNEEAAFYPNVEERRHAPSTSLREDLPTELDMETTAPKPPALSLEGEIDDLFSFDVKPAMETSHEQYPEEVVPPDAIQALDDQVGEDFMQVSFMEKGKLSPALADVEEESGYRESKEALDDGGVKSDFDEQLDFFFGDSMTEDLIEADDVFSIPDPMVAAKTNQQQPESIETSSSDISATALPEDESLLLEDDDLLPSLELESEGLSPALADVAEPLPGEQRSQDLFVEDQTIQSELDSFFNDLEQQVAADPVEVAVAAQEESQPVQQAEVDADAPILPTLETPGQEEDTLSVALADVNAPAEAERSHDQSASATDLESMDMQLELDHFLETLETPTLASPEPELDAPAFDDLETQSRQVTPSVEEAHSVIPTADKGAEIDLDARKQDGLTQDLDLVFVDEPQDLPNLELEKEAETEQEVEEDMLELLAADSDAASDAKLDPHTEAPGQEALLDEDESRQASVTEAAFIEASAPPVDADEEAPLLLEETGETEDTEQPEETAVALFSDLPVDASEEGEMLFTQEELDRILSGQPEQRSATDAEIYQASDLSSPIERLSPIIPEQEALEFTPLEDISSLPQASLHEDGKIALEQTEDLGGFDLEYPDAPQAEELLGDQINVSIVDASEIEAPVSEPETVVSEPMDLFLLGEETALPDQGAAVTTLDASSPDLMEEAAFSAEQDSVETLDFVPLEELEEQEIDFFESEPTVSIVEESEETEDFSVSLNELLQADVEEDVIEEEEEPIQNQELLVAPEATTVDENDLLVEDAFFAPNQPANIESVPQESAEPGLSDEEQQASSMLLHADQEAAQAAKSAKELETAFVAAMGVILPALRTGQLASEQVQTSIQYVQELQQQELAPMQRASLIMLESMLRTLTTHAPNQENAAPLINQLYELSLHPRDEQVAEAINAYAQWMENKAQPSAAAVSPISIQSAKEYYTARDLYIEIEQLRLHMQQQFELLRRELLSRP